MLTESNPKTSVHMHDISLYQKLSGSIFSLATLKSREFLRPGREL